MIRLIAGIAWLVAPISVIADEPPFDTQKNAPKFSTPAEALAAWKVPPEFRVSLFAHEPMVRQPIAMTFDPRGRIWIAENDTYAESPVHYEDRFFDRIIVLEDSDGDQRADKRTVFWDKAKQLTSVEVGFGGVWAMCPPNLLFIPDRDGDDKPDGAPEVVLDGFFVGAGNRHNFANGLKWGPDGWLYGRHGITHTGMVGRPGTPDSQRTMLGPGIWRVHPITKKFEVVCTGTTNPWGHDWDEHGELFFINTVIGHLWHSVPGAHFKRMFGEDPNPHVYELIDQTADHVHWDTGEHWGDAKKGLSASTDKAGGGHAHCGFMIYLGDNWPREMRGKAFTLNMHGRRINCDRLERDGASYIGKHDPDLFFTSDEWFRGIELAYGPDGGVYVLDWSDVGECHENDGVHRSSGRIFKIDYGRAGVKQYADLSKLNSVKLAEIQSESNEWNARQARRLLHERASAGQNLDDAGRILQAGLTAPATPAIQLRHLWCLHLIGKLDEKQLHGLLHSENEHIRVWAVRLLVERRPWSQASIKKLENAARNDSSGLVLLYLASSLQRLDGEVRQRIELELASRAGFEKDRVLPLLIWYGIAIGSKPDDLHTYLSSPMPTIRRFYARALAERVGANPDLLKAICSPDFFAKIPSAAQGDVLAGISDGLRGVRKVEAPPGWELLKSTKLAKSSDPEVRRLTREISVVFGDGRALSEIENTAKDTKLDSSLRKSAIKTLVDARPANLTMILQGLLADKEIAAEAVRGFAVDPKMESSRLLIGRFGGLYPQAKVEAIAVLAGRPASAAMLLDAIEKGQVGKEHVGVVHVRQMQTYSEKSLAAALAKLWPELQPISTPMKERIAAYRTKLTPANLKAANTAAGRKLWDKSCAKCHTLFGVGGKIGPDITGSQRHNLDYLLENIVDPSATLLGNFKSSTIALADGRVISGVVLSKNDRVWDVQTATDRMSIPASDVENATLTNKSLMPDGLLDVLSPDEVRDLIGYIMSPQQVN